MKCWLLSLAGLLLLSAGHVLSYSYLMVLTTSAKSHFYVGEALAKGLVAAGHEVTLISAFPQQQPMQGLIDIATPSIISAMAVDKAKILQRMNVPMIKRMPLFHALGLKLTRTLLAEPAVQQLLQQKRSYDAVICEIFLNEAQLGFAEHFKAPLIALSSFGASSWTTELVGTPSPLSYVPHALLKFSDRMSRYERAQNLLFTAYEKLLRQWRYLPQQQQLYEQYFPHNKQRFDEMLRNTALVLLNQHVSLSSPRPYAANMIEVGGMHIKRQSQTLPKHMAQFIEEFFVDSDYGGRFSGFFGQEQIDPPYCIYFSMGSNLNTADLPPAKRQALINTFAKLKQRVLWKFEEPQLAGKPDNVYIADWFPQTAVLAHPNVKLFITHGGLLSSTEAIYHATPIVGIPLFGDQFLNMARAEQSGYGVTVMYDQLNVDTFHAAIAKVLYDPSYAQRVQEMSARFRDQPQAPLERAVYWVEHVSRHKGAKYLRNAGQDLSFIEYHNLDVIAILLCIFLFILLIFVCLLLIWCKRLQSKSKRMARKIKRK